MKLQGGSGGGKRAGRAEGDPGNEPGWGPRQRGRGEDGEGRGREEALERAGRRRSEGTVGTPASLRLVGLALGRPRSPRVDRRRSPRHPP